MKLLVVSHALIQEAAQVRWRRLAARHDIRVRILVPERWRNPDFGEGKIVFEGKPARFSGFEVCTVPVSDYQDNTRYRIKNLRAQLRDYRPDVIFCIHEEGLAVHLQSILYRRLFSPRSRLLYFSMRLFPRVPPLRPLGLRSVLKRMIFGGLWHMTCTQTDGAVVHYPGIASQMRSEGYRKKILVQTQIGVDTEVFKPDAEDRAKVRGVLGISDAEVVVGTAGRVVEAKGMLDVVRACSMLAGRWRLLVVGDGPDRAKVEALAKSQGVLDRLQIVGYVPMASVASFMRAMDIFVLGSRTTSTWVDTFPLVVAQAMASGLAVVGSNSGAIPFQLGGRGLVFSEGDTAELASQVQRLLDDQNLRAEMGLALRERGLSEFSVEGINRSFLEFLAQELP